jgi:Uncharacterized protein conserved in bacteria (DUF2171)
VDEGLPIAYEVLDRGVPVYASDGQQVGTVDRVLAAPQEDIFHGVVIRSGHERHTVPADQIASLHERGVDLRIDSAAVSALAGAETGTPAWRDREPGVKPSRWKHFVDLLTGAEPRRRNWSEQD